MHGGILREDENVPGRGGKAVNSSLEIQAVLVAGSEGQRSTGRFGLSSVGFSTNTK